MTRPHDVQQLLDALLPRMQALLGQNLLGVYLRGSLALGDFIPETSDLDLLAVTRQPVSAPEFSALAAMHVQLAASSLVFARRLELAYIDQLALRRFEPGQRHPTLGQGEELAWSEHRDNWILERWTVRERGVTLLGPPAAMLIDPIAPEALRQAVRSRLQDWADWASQPDDPDWLLPRAHKAYVVETMCRALHTLASCALASKPRAVAWALAALPEPWRSLVERSQTWRSDYSSDPTLVPEVRALVHWAATDGAVRFASGPC